MSTTLEDSTAHKLAKGAVEQLGTPSMSFTPINQIHQHLSGIHCYAHDMTRQVTSEHYCTHIKGNMHQCVIYDKDGPDARLIGVEYIVDEATFKSLPEDEKRYWHSHSFEVESGMLTVVGKTGVPSPIMDAAERPVLQDLRRTFGKTCHTWQFDIHPDLPLGPPQMMMSFTKDEQIDQKVLGERDAALGISSADKRKQRESWLEPPSGQYEKPEGVDCWSKDGTSWQLEAKQVKMKMKQD